jgi:hypothetical protein
MDAFPLQECRAETSLCYSPISGLLLGLQRRLSSLPINLAACMKPVNGLSSHLFFQNVRFLAQSLATYFVHVLWRSEDLELATRR